MTTTTTVRHEVAVDTAIAEAHLVEFKARRNAEVARKYRDGFQGEDRLIDADKALAIAEAARYAAEREYGGWSRFFLLTSSAHGHIHRNMRCSTCRWDSQYAWLPELSGLTEADAVAEYGSILCSVCFPSAPVEWTNGVNKKTAEQKRIHKALLDIERSPEGRKVKTLTQQLRSLVSSIDYGRSRVEWLAEKVERHRDHPGGVADEQARLAEAQKSLAAAEKKVPKAEAKLAAAQAALDAALSA
jgi:hypothetical protein